MLRASRLQKDFAGRNVLDSIDLTIGRGQKIGLVGPNGCGKSTFLQILAGLIQPDAGRVVIDPCVKLKYLPQQFEGCGADSIWQFLAPDAHYAGMRMRELEESMCTGAVNTQPQDAQNLEAFYAEAAEAFENAGGYLLEAKMEKTLSGLGLGGLNLNRALNSLSGGQRARIGLARALLGDADLLLLLDEPTNNLDLESLTWLEAALSSLRAPADQISYLIVSHDRRFLDSTTNLTIEMSRGIGINRRAGASIKQYSGNYSWYRLRKSQEEERQLREFDEQQERVKRLTADVIATKNQSLRTEYATTNDYLRGRSKKVAAKAKARETRLNKMLSDEERVDRPAVVPAMQLQLSGRKLYDSLLIHLKSVSLHRSDSSIFENVSLQLSGNQRIALVGSNGAGKSSLLQLLIGELVHTDGELWTRPGLRVGYMSQNQEGLSEQATVIEYFMEKAQERNATDARSFLHRFQFCAEGVFQRICQLSRGERAKLVLATFMADKLDMIVLDEPTNHLDVTAMECLETALRAFTGALIVVSHDRYLLEQLKISVVWRIRNGFVSVELPTDGMAASTR